VVYDILKKKKEGDLRDRSRAPLYSPYKTPAEIEDKVVEVKNQTRLWAKRLSVYLQKYEKIKAALRGPDQDKTWVGILRKLSEVGYY